MGKQREHLVTRLAGSDSPSLGGPSLLRGTCLGDVLRAPEHAQGHPRIVGDDRSAAVHATHLPIVQDDPMLELEGASVGQRALHGRPHLVPVIGMHPADEVFEREWLVPLDAVESAELIRPVEGVGPDLPFPAADAAERLDLRESLGRARRSILGHGLEL